MRFPTAAGVAALVLSGVPALLSAQQASCNIDPNSPKELAIISIGLQQARALPAGETRTAAIRKVIKDLETKPERFAKNPAGYNYVMSQAVSLAALEPSIGLNPTRGQLGFAANPDQAYDLVEGLNGMMDVIGKSSPACADDLDEIKQGDVWLAFTRRALEASNTGQLDSAEIYARRSMALAANNPYPHHVMAVVANARNDRAAAIGHWKQVISTAGNDSSYAEIKMQSQYYVAMSELEAARSAPQGADKVTAGKRAAEAIREFMASAPSSTELTMAMNALAEAYAISGETAQMATVYKPMLDAPTKYDDNVLTMAGVIATQAGNADDARTLFEAAIAQNPYSRDALRNLAATYHTKEQYTQMYKPLDVLRTLDPNNVDAWLMYAYAAQGQQKTAKTPAEKKTWSDSLLKYAAIADSMKAKVEVVGFARGSDVAELELQIEQAGDGAGNYTVVVEFIDKAGNVVASQTQKAGPIAKGATASVKFKGTGNGIIAYRYKPLT